MEVTTDNYEKHTFGHVISTIPLPVLRSIDLTKANLSLMQANAIRQLNYGPLSQDRHAISHRLVDDGQRQGRPAVEHHWRPDLHRLPIAHRRLPVLW